MITWGLGFQGLALVLASQFDAWGWGMLSEWMSIVNSWVSCEYESEVSNPGLSPSLPRSAGWGSPSHSHTRWPPGVGLTNLIRRQGVHTVYTVYYISVHLLSCHLRLLTDLCGEVLLGHLLGLPALRDQFAHIHVNLVLCLETLWGNSKVVPSTKEH